MFRIKLGAPVNARQLAHYLSYVRSGPDVVAFFPFVETNIPLAYSPCSRFVVKTRDSEVNGVINTASILFNPLMEGMTVR